MPSLEEIDPVILGKKMNMWKVYRRTDRRTTDNRRSEKLYCAFSSGELKSNQICRFFVIFVLERNGRRGWSTYVVSLNILNNAGTYTDINCWNGRYPEGPTCSKMTTALLIKLFAKWKRYIQKKFCCLNYDKDSLIKFCFQSPALAPIIGIEC